MITEDMPKIVESPVIVKMPAIIEKMAPEIVLTMEDIRLESINFGIVPVGETKELTIQAENIGGFALLEMQVNPGHKDVSVVSCPEKLDLNEKGNVVLSYKPETQVDRGISVDLKITGKYVV
jgi:hypothetical protein